MPRMRTIPDAAKYFKATDPDTCMTEFRLRQMATNGEIGCVKAGKKYLLNLDDVEAYFDSLTASTASKAAPAPQQGVIRPVKI